MNKPRFIRTIWPLCALFIGASAFSCASKEEAANRTAKARRDQAAAKAIVAEMKDVYAACETYADEGVVRVTIKLGENPKWFTEEQRFFTHFAGPDRLRFEERMRNRYGGEEDVAIFWASGEQVRSSGYLSYLFEFDDDEDTVDAGPTWESLMQAVAEVSDVPALLLPKKAQAVKGGIKALQGIEMQGEEEIDGATCVKIMGTLPDELVRDLPGHPLWHPSEEVRIHATATLWIDKETKLLRQIHQSVTIEDLGEIDVALGPDIELPTMHLDVTKTFRTRLNTGLRWYELAFGESGDPDAEQTPVDGWVPDDFKPTKKNAKSARAAARKILGEMADVYAGCRTYRDKGVIEMVAVDRGADLTEQWGFDTAFRRPGRFRYEYRDTPTDGTPQRHIYWSASGKTRSWGLHWPDVEEWETLPGMIEEAIPNTNALVKTMAELLMPETIEASLPATAEDAILLGYQDLDGKRCYKVRARHPLTRMWFSMFIEKKRKLLRRIEAKTPGNGVPIWLTLTCEPRIDKKVTKKQLRFDPPPAPQKGKPPKDNG